MSGFSKFEELLAAVRSLGVNIVPQVEEIIIKLITDGILIEDEKDIVRTSSGIYNILPDGCIKKIIVHITQRELQTEDIDDIKQRHKYHLFNCQTLQYMEQIGRGNKYFKSARSDGLFNYTIHVKQSQKSVGPKPMELWFCKNCKSIYDSRFNPSKLHPFDLRRFIETNEFHSDVSFRKIDSDDVPNVYAEDWIKISSKTKESKNYVCEDCKISLAAPAYHRFLHGHHIDGQKSNNVLANIKILCIACHANQALHSHIRNDPAYREFLKTDAFKKHHGKGTPNDF